jgi:guanylate kinase
MSILFIISAPSGSGKSTLVRELLKRDANFHFSISYTTREPRGDEREGQNYHYVSREEFEARIANNEFLEWAQVFGNYYGTHSSALDDARVHGKDLLLDIDVQGARQLMDRVQDAVSIFVLPPSREQLEQRLRGRGEDTEEVIEKRLAGAAREIRAYDQYQYILVNDDVDAAAARLCAIVEAERQRRAHPDVQRHVREILATFES